MVHVSNLKKTKLGGPPGRVGSATSRQHLDCAGSSLLKIVCTGLTLVYALWIGYRVGLRLTDSSTGGLRTADDLGSFRPQDIRLEEGLDLLTPDSSIFSICNQTQKSALQTWIDHLDDILMASQLPLDRDYELKFINAAVLDEISKRLPLSIKSLPRQNVAELLLKLEKRLSYLQKPALYSTEPPPISIAILGGSVTAGVNCNTGIKRLYMERCAWPKRFEELINNLAAGKDDSPLVVLDVIAVGGTNTATGAKLLQFELLPAGKPDIVVNAYSTNDMHVLTMKEASSENMTIREMVFQMAQDFSRIALKCNDMLLIWLDDYIGNEQREILATTELSQSIQVLSNYYGFGFVSYADAVRDLVYANTKESTYSPSGWFVPGKEGMRREIHPGQGMHIATAYILAYNFLHISSIYCSLQNYEKSDHNLDRKSENVVVNEKIKENEPVPSGFYPAGLPPPLLHDLTLDTVSQKWHNATREQCSATSTCPLTWLSGMPYKPVSWIKGFFRSVVQEPFDWAILDDTGRGNKVGFLPLEGKAEPKLVMVFDRKTHNADRLRVITLFYLKSYGDKWNDSAVNVSIDRFIGNSWSPATVPQVLTGTHDKRTSETYTETIEMDNIEETASQVRLSLKLIGGTTFKLLGIAVCY